MKKLRVLVLMDPTMVPPASLEGYTEKEISGWKTEYHVVTTLRKLGHDVRPLGVHDELRPIREALDDWKPHIVFNLLEEFHGMVEFDYHVVSFLELMKARYTGCSPRGLVVARDKALSKKILHFHRIRVPKFAVFPRGRKIRPPLGFPYPAIVKSLTSEASLGIAQASVVDTEAKLCDRVRFIHDKVETDAIAEQYIEGRELYVSILCHQRPEVLPAWELLFENMPAGSMAIATDKVKHDPDYQEKRGIFQQMADIPDALAGRIAATSRRIFKLLYLDGYARIDYRLDKNGDLYFLEANPNPEIAPGEVFAEAADAVGYTYPALLQKILNLGLRRGR